MYRDPMIPHNYPFPYTPPPSKPDQKKLSASLKRAIQAKDVKEARKIFDTAFWNNIELVPDWHHLFLALLGQDKPMIRLLATHGATWTDEEARCLKKACENRWPEFMENLRKAGIYVNENSEAQPADMYASVMISHRILMDTDGFLSPEEKEKTQKDAEKLLSMSIVQSLHQGDTEMAIKLLKYRQPKGLIDFDHEFKELLMLDIMNSQHVTDIIDTLLAKNVNLKSIKIDFITILFYPEIITALDKRGMLAPSQPGRERIFSQWCGADTKKDYQCYKDATLALFKKERPLTSEEPDSFIELHENMIAQGRAAILNRICGDLREAGFFKMRAWTTERLHALTGHAPEDPSLKKEFNQKMSHDHFSKISGKKLIKPESMALFVEAHKEGLYKADHGQMRDFLWALQQKYKSSPIPDEVKQALKTLKDSGVFQTYSKSFLGENYLGRKEPGLAKVLLDLDILKATDFGLNSDKFPEFLKEFSTALRPPSPYSEFFYQLYLEKNHPGEFIPQRGKIASYHNHFIAKMTGLGPPPPPPPRRNRW